MKKFLVCLGFAMVVGAAMLPLACNSNASAPVYAAAPPTATPTGCAGTVRGNNDATPVATIQMTPGDMVAIPVSIGGTATTVNKLSVFYSDTGTMTGSDVLETALYSVKSGKATLVAGTTGSLLISAPVTYAWANFSIGNVSLNKNTQYVILARWAQDAGNTATSSFGIASGGAAVTTSYNTNTSSSILLPGTSWTLPTAGGNGYELNITTCP